jgi:hypothetical protein
VEFQPTFSVFERAKTVHTSDGAASVIGCLMVKIKGKIIPVEAVEALRVARG